MKSVTMCKHICTYVHIYDEIKTKISVKEIKYKGMYIVGTC